MPGTLGGNGTISFGKNALVLVGVLVSSLSLMQSGFDEPDLKLIRIKKETIISLLINLKRKSF